MSKELSADFRRLSHAYILSAPSREEGLEMAKELSMMALCSAGGETPCGTCRNCRKVLSGIHPDVSFVRRLVDDKGKEKKEIVVDQIRYLVADASILPNEAQRKIYIIDQAELMNTEAQNAALKLLEEPPSWLILALCTVNAHRLLPTVRSRCVERSRSKGADEADKAMVKLALEYISILASGDSWARCRFCFAHEGMDTQSALGFIRTLEECAVDMLCGRRDKGLLDRGQLMALCELTGRCQDYFKVNTGVKHIFGLLAAFSVSA